MYRKKNIPFTFVFRYVMSQLQTWHGPVATYSLGGRIVGGFED
jgi:hypothetical protein